MSLLANKLRVHIDWLYQQAHATMDVDVSAEFSRQFLEAVSLYEQLYNRADND
jgi:hypothetical protein